MSFLAGRMAATEGAFFKEQSKAAAKLLKEKMDPKKLAEKASSPNTNANADTLPEILMHSPPTPPPGFSPPSVVAKRPPSPVPEGSSLAGFSQSILKQVTKVDGPPRLGLSKIIGKDPVERFSPSLPREATFGPRRWNLEHSPGSQPVPSTANAARLEAEPVVDPPTQEEVREGMVAIAKAFAVSTTLVFGGAAVAIGYLGYRLEWHSLKDIKTKSREVMVPRVEAIREWFKPTQQWALQKAEKWKLQEAERQALGVEFANSLGVQPPEQLKWQNNVEQSSRQQA
ncbi:unnamed protein product [Calypogeia fissa]